jgi:hypothetical protein
MLSFVSVVLPFKRYLKLDMYPQNALKCNKEKELQCRQDTDVKKKKVQ